MTEQKSLSERLREDALIKENNALSSRSARAADPQNRDEGVVK